MAIAPVEIRHTKLKKSLFGGYRKRATNEFLEQITESFEETWREREDLRDRVHQLESELTRHRELETLLRETLVTAEKSVIELKDQARTEAELVVREAHTAARSITQDALSERERLLGEATRVRALLQAALTTVDESEHEAVPARAEAA
jgi:cell division initiation protein